MGDKKTILIVDDEEDICECLADYFEERNFHVKAFPRIREALDYVAKNKVCAVFLDNLLLDECQGIDYIPRFKTLQASTKIHIITACKDPKVRLTAQAQGADGYLIKPIEFETLDAALRKL